MCQYEQLFSVIPSFFYTALPDDKCAMMRSENNQHDLSSDHSNNIDI